MRIRKRKAPFPLSSLSPVPLSDPQFTDHLQLQNFSPIDDKVPNFGPQSSDQLIGDGGNSPDSSDYGCSQEQKKKEGREDQKEEDKSNNRRKGKFLLGARTPRMVIQDSSCCVQGKDNVEENKLKNPQRRRGSLERISGGDISVLQKAKKMMKTKIKSSYSVKKKVIGGAVMEGSRCSRVNGRGWRCCQATLVGYSLCEHHLGKGRLRSMTSVRSQFVTNSTPKKIDSKTSPEGEETKGVPLDDEVFDVYGHGEEKQQQPLLTSKKKQKLGTVKARSISSLLGEANDDAIEIAK